ncbi:histidine ammonia-lyase [Leifsonia xyli subsp. xyli str. CTCB07]|uniref:Histidine ammonia-lyase n=1 Tax=Leifsonia xyli subsp. xyli (strain CTCB07) TaxID=281090 RepID=Q6ACJ5_LEIXX|nr:aromatic amino acid lyase [Leifsonia xyli]AAT89898.1 histidine ammonia-lyase [Leifsonia xyli subsp. xyli str. CTCB07]
MLTTAPAATAVALGAHPLTIAEVVAVARHDAPVTLDPGALDAVGASRAIVEALADDIEPHYGISTGVGALATTFIPGERRAPLQASLVRSHAAGIQPLVLAEKEGLALINGTDGMLGMLCLALHDLGMLLTTADIAAAMSVEALLGTDAVFADDLQRLRPQTGQALSAENLRALLAGSPLVASHKGPECTRVQDAYTLRCAPQVHGGTRDTVAHATLVAGRELASAIDNPVLTPDGRVESNGNFHGAPVAYALDFLAIVAADVASMSERRTDRFLDPARNQGLPPFLAHEVGVDSGLMIAQYTAAGIVSELKRLANPASADSIPSSAMQEDHVSMGWAAGRKLRRAVDGLTRVLAIEALTAARGADLRAPLRQGPATAAVTATLRESVAGPGPDRSLSHEIEAAVALVASPDPHPLPRHRLLTRSGIEAGRSEEAIGE